MAVLLKRGLEEEGYAVDTTGDGLEAVWMAQEHEYDVIVLDRMLPGLDGIEVCKRLRDAGHWPPILLLTARDGVGDRIEGLDAGADDYLPKPFAFGELLARLRALLRRGAPERPAVLTVGDLTLDPSTRAVTRAGDEICLTATEYSVLEVLMRHAGQVLSRQAILDHGWDFAYDATSNVVDQYVGYLRRKLDKPYGRNDIETLRGAGYRLRVSAGPDGAA